MIYQTNTKSVKNTNKKLFFVLINLKVSGYTSIFFIIQKIMMMMMMSFLLPSFVWDNCPIKNQILYFSIHSIKYTVIPYIYTVFQYICAKYSIKTVYKVYCITVYFIFAILILYTVVQNTVYLQYTLLYYILKYSILTVSKFFIGILEAVQ